MVYKPLASNYFEKRVESVYYQYNQFKHPPILMIDSKDILRHPNQPLISSMYNGFVPNKSFESIKTDRTINYKLVNCRIIA